MLQTGLLCLVLLRLHPRPIDHTPTYEFTTAFWGVMFGTVSSVNMMPPPFTQPPSEVLGMWQQFSVLFMLRRLAVGRWLHSANEHSFHCALVMLLCLQTPF